LAGVGWRKRLPGKADQGTKKLIKGFHNDEVVYVSLGDGTNSEGEFWEALNTACQFETAGGVLLEITATRSAFPSRCKPRAATFRN